MNKGEGKSRYLRKGQFLARLPPKKSARAIAIDINFLGLYDRTYILKFKLYLYYYIYIIYYYIFILNFLHAQC